jgi:hypothetical protein
MRGMKKAIVEIFILAGCFYGQTETSEINLYYFSPSRIQVELKADLLQKAWLISRFS